MQVTGPRACFIVWLGMAIACGGESPTAPGTSSVDPRSNSFTPIVAAADWPTSTPEAEGLDPSILLDLVTRIRRGEHGRVTSLLIVRHGRLVVEEYFFGWTMDRPHTIQSVTKSVTSLLTGIAVEQGALRVTDKAADFFPDYRPIANDDARKAAMTVGDLLTMRSGYDWSEAVYAGSPLNRLNQCGCDWLRFMLDWPMREQPGTRREYVSGSTILLGGVIGRATGVRLDRFASEHLFEPLDMENWTWTLGLPDGLPHSGGGLGLRPRDMAKLGVLMADGGRWRGRSLVPEGWIRDSTRRVSSAWTFNGHRTGYGYLWWLLDLADPMNRRPQPGDVITGSGARGQWIFAVPALRLVVSSTGENQDAPFAAINFLYTHALASVR